MDDGVDRRTEAIARTLAGLYYTNVDVPVSIGIGVRLFPDKDPPIWHLYLREALAVDRELHW